MLIEDFYASGFRKFISAQIGYENLSQNFWRSIIVNNYNVSPKRCLDANAFEAISKAPAEKYPVYNPIIIVKEQKLIDFVWEYFFFLVEDPVLRVSKIL